MKTVQQVWNEFSKQHFYAAERCAQDIVKSYEIGVFGHDLLPKFAHALEKEGFPVEQSRKITIRHIESIAVMLLAGCGLETMFDE